MVRVKAHEIKAKEKGDLLKDLAALRNELSGLRVAQVTGGTPAKLAKIREVRKSIAVVLTVYNQTQKAKLRTVFKKKKFLPLDLRPKLTRALRRRMTPSQAAAMTVKQKKKRIHFPQRKYAIKD